MSIQKRKYSLVYMEKNQVVFAKDRPLHMIIFIYFSLFIILAINPVDRMEWWYGNVGSLAIIILLSLLYKRNRLSTISYTYLLIFLILHSIGTHYSYSMCPVGEWMKTLFGFSRNNYDRLVYFAFGALASSPVVELLYQKIRVRYIQACILSFAVILTSGTLYELVEMYSFFLLDSREANMFMGFQGDMWDTQKDLTMCLIGVAFSMGIRILIDIKKNNRIHMIRRIK